MKRPAHLPLEPALPESRPAYPSLLDLALRSGRRAAVVGGAMAALAGAPGCDAPKSAEPLPGSSDLVEDVLDDGSPDARDDAPWPDLAGADVGSLPEVELDVPVAPEPELAGDDVSYIPDLPGVDVPMPDLLPEGADEVASPELAGVSDIGSSDEVGPVDALPADGEAADLPPTSDGAEPTPDAVLPTDRGA